MSARIEQEAQRLLAAQTDVRGIIRGLLHPNARSPEAGRKIGQLLQEIDFSDKKQDDSGIVNEAYELYPEDVAQALVWQLEKGRRLPFRSEGWLRASNIRVDEGPLLQHLMQPTTKDSDAAAAVSVVGPKVVGELIDRLTEVHGKMRATKGSYDKALSDEYQRLSSLIENSRSNSFIEAVLERSQTDNPDRIALLADLISRHGRDVERGLLALDGATHERITGVVRGWGEMLLASPAATRAQFAEIAEAAERLASPTLVPMLQKLLAEDLARWKKAKEEFVAARQKGIENDAQMSWTLQYRRAFAAIGDTQAVEIMKTYLPHPEFGVEAAHVLKAVWQESQPAEDERAFLRTSPDFSVVKDEYTKRKARQQGSALQFAEDILAVVNELIRPGSESERYRHALNLSAVAFSMPYVGKEDTIASLLKLPRPTIEKQTLLTVLVLAGETIPSDVVLQGIEELLQQAKSNPWVLQDQEGWRLDVWLRLLPFTENVGSVLAVLDRLEERHKAPWNLRGLLSALTYSPSDEAENVLSELAKKDQRFLKEHDWLVAMTKRNTLNAARILLDLVSNVSSPGEKGTLDDMNLGKDLAVLMSFHKQFREEVYQRYRSLPEGRAKNIIEYAIAEGADAQAVLLLVRDAAARGTLIGATALHTALRHVLVGQRPSTGWSGMQELYSLPASDLRRELFRMVVSGSAAESQLASKCLTRIDQIRDDYGQVETERRHPDITAGIAWPQISPRS